MLRFPAELPDGSSVAKRSDSLNAAQHLKQSNDVNPFFLRTEEDLHDARRVQAHGQEDDLKMALSMLIERVSEMSSMLAEAYRSHADLEVQLNVTKSNLKLVISNNEMLEEALSQDRTVGWRRGGGSNSDTSNHRPFSADYAVSQQQQQPSQQHLSTSDLSSTSQSPSSSPPATQDSRFFTRFRFSSRPATPTSAQSTMTNGVSHSVSNSSPLPSPTAFTSQITELQAELQKEREATRKVVKEKTELEAELESLSQALFEEANKMVSQERKKLAHTNDELEQERVEKIALKDALQVIATQNQALREASAGNTPSIQFATQSERMLTRTISDFSLMDETSFQTQSRRSTEQLDVDNPPLSRSSSSSGIKSTPSSRSSSLSRRGPPEPIFIPLTLSPPSSVSGDIDQPGAASSDLPRSGETTARQATQVGPSADSPVDNINLSTNSTEPGMERYPTPVIPASTWSVGHVPSASSTRVTLSI